MTKFSVIVPVYNVEKYLECCLNSLMEQTYINWEAILIDDGSTDNSSSICDKYAIRDNRFLVVHQKNKGAAIAKNIGLNLAKGDIITFLDSDDYVEKEWLQVIYNTFIKKNVQIVEYQFDKVYCDKSERMINCNSNIIINKMEYLKQYVNVWTCSLFWNKAFKAELLNNVRFLAERRCIDDEFFTYKVIANADKIIRLPNVLYHYRQRKSSAIKSRENRIKITNDALDVLDIRYKWVKKTYPSLTEIYLNHDINIMFLFSTYEFDAHSVKKYKKLSKFYLREVIFNNFTPKRLYLALKLNLLSKNNLLKKKEITVDNKLYFE